MRPFRSLQRYDPGTNVLETLFQVDGQGVLRLTDFMPWTDDARASVYEVHRRLECVEGAVDIDVVFDPRFDYGRADTVLTVSEHGVAARSRASDERLVLAVPTSSSWRDYDAGGMSCRFRLTAGNRKWCVLSWGAERPEAIEAYRSFEHLRATRRSWRDWSARFQYDGPWRHHVMRSALALKLLIYAPSGGMVAAPTTSLPEWFGGARNWDYRYIWTRDAAMAIRATNMIGYIDEARDFFHFMRDALDHCDTLQILYSVDTMPAPDEETLPNLAGFRGSKPVRIGNAARDQVQLDTAGALIDAAYLFERFGGSLTYRVWRHLRSIINSVQSRWREPDHGIWEPRTGMRHNVHSKMMSWLALDRGSRLAVLFGDNESGARWKQEATVVLQDFCKNGLDASGRRFVGSYGEEHPDAALLLIPIHGALEATDPRVLETVQWVKHELSDGPFLYRYLREDGVGGEEGAFTLCGFWLAEVLAMADRLEEAQEVFVAHTNAANHIGLLAEEIDPTTREQLGNFPQAFSHLGLINAAVRIDDGLRRRDKVKRWEPGTL